MFTYFKLKKIFLPVLIVASFLTACNKQDTLTGETSTSSIIAAAASLTSASENAAVTDSIYLIQPCGRGTTRDSIAESELPSSVSGYLTTNYTPYTFYKAFAIKANSVITGYVAVIYYNDKPVGLQFDANGNFVKVLEQREKGDLNGRGWHEGGRFGGRGYPSKDSVSLSDLPASIEAYFEVNYSTDTLLKAYKNRDSSYVILSKNNGLFANVFSADGTFVSRNELTSRHGNCDSTAQADLPSTILTYMDVSYPSYVFKKAFVQKNGGVIQSYIVFIDANNTKYALEFDSTGTFLRSKTIN